jgi:DNA repair exonuclease SbcCD ATPase subunit
MTDPAVAPETPDVAETVSFLRRFADLMANGYNGSYLRRAADLLESLTAQSISASDEEGLWRDKYESLTQHADALETECDSLKSDIEGHLDIASALLAERETLGGTLQAREAELAVLRETLGRERDERAAKSAAHEEALNELRAAFDQKREALQAALEARVEECDQLRRDLDREREVGAKRWAAREGDLSGLRLAFDRERDELQAQLKARGDELAMFRMDSEREHDALREKVAALEAKRVELRSAFDRINTLRNQTIVPPAGAEAAAKPAAAAEAVPLPARRNGQEAGETNAVVPKTTLRQARAQFEYLAREFIPLGDIASQVMCELGAYTMDMALIGGQPNDHLPVGEVARSILAPVPSNRS